MYKNSLYSILIVSLFSASSCINTKKKVAKSREKAAAAWQEELNLQQEGRRDIVYAANWTKAKEDLLWKSPNIIRAEYRMDDSIENKMRLWKTFIPSLNASFSDSATFGEITNLFADTSLRVSSFFSFGSLLDMPVRHATLAVTHMGVEWNAEITMRNEVIGLYRIFREKELLDRELRLLKANRAFIHEVAIKGGEIDSAAKLKSSDEELKAYQSKITDWVNKFSDLHEISYSDVKLSYGGLPDIRYSPSDLDLSDSSRWGVLQMNLLALEELSEQASLSSVYKRYYPTPSLSLSAPALYSNSSNTQFRLEDFRIGPSLSWSLDTRGSIGSQIRRLKREKRFKKWSDDRRRQTEVKKLLDGKNALRDVQKEIVDTRSTIKEYKEVVNLGLVGDLEQALNQMRRLRTQEITLMAKEIDISTSFWLLDENRWGETTKQWKRVRVEREKQKPKKWYMKPFLRKAKAVAQ